jgi:hypothetical protein
MRISALIASLGLLTAFSGTALADKPVDPGAGGQAVKEIVAIIRDAGDNFGQAVSEAVTPRFYFDVRAEGQFHPDPLGTELVDVNAAEREAAEVAAHLGRDRFPRATNRAIIVEVRDENEARVTTATASLLSCAPRAMRPGQ